MLGCHHFQKFLIRHLKCMKEPIRSKIWTVYQSAVSDRLLECTNQVAQISFILWKSQIIARKLLAVNAIQNRMDLTPVINFVVVEDTKNKQKQQQNQFGKRVDSNGVAVSNVTQEKSPPKYLLVNERKCLKHLVVPNRHGSDRMVHGS